MGVLCELFIADPERALKYGFRGECKCKTRRSCKCWDEYDFTTYDHIDNHRVYDRDFAQLLSILRGKKHRESVLKEFKLIEQHSEEGPWIQKVPDDLPKLLAPATPAELKPIAEAWVRALDAVYPEPTKNEVLLDYLKLLYKLCKKSIKNRQGMYLWTSL